MKRVLSALRLAIRNAHGLIARSQTATRCYVGTLGRVARCLPEGGARDLIEWAITGQRIAWPHIAFAPRRVNVGNRTRIQLVPHLCEVDQSTLFRKRFESDAHVLGWLERCALQRYDAVIDIGANMGLYALFFDALICSAAPARLRHVYAFEPSRKAYARLLANIEVNGARSISPFCAAISNRSGVAEFYQPRDRLVNGSLSKSFAQLFSEPIDSEYVVTLSGSDLAPLFQRHARLLIKVDAEGLEPEILSALAPLIERHRPDLLVEILRGVDERLEAMACLKGYHRFHMLPSGPAHRDEFRADASERDWLLTANAGDLRRACS